MTRLVAAEVFKLRTTRTFYALIGGALALVLVIVIPVAAFNNFTPDSEPLRDLMGIVGLMQAFVLVLGILTITSEFRHGTITPSLLVVPHRTQLTLAKLAASIAVGLAIGLITTALVAAIVKGIGSARDFDTSGDVAGYIVGGTLATGLFAALGLGLGAVARNQVGAIVGALVYIFVAEPLIGVIPGIDDAVQKFGLGGVSGALFGTSTNDDALGHVAGGLLFAAYAAVFIAVGIALMRKRDVTA